MNGAFLALILGLGIFAVGFALAAWGAIVAIGAVLQLLRAVLS